MSLLALVTSILVLLGSAFMAAAMFQGRKIKGRVPFELQRRWRMMITLMLFFQAGYLFLVVILVKHLSFPIELITGPIFFGGAFFVFIVINLSNSTIDRLQTAKDDFRKLNESLERLVMERTEELRRSHQFLKNVLDSLNDCVIIIDVKDFKVVGANTAFLNEYSLTESAAIGKTCYEITHNRTDKCKSPDNICPLLQTVETGEFSSAEHVHYDKNADRLFTEVSTSPIRDYDGGIRQVVHVSRDITERKKDQEALLWSQEQLKNILDSIRAGIMIINPRTHKIVDVNAFAATMIGTPKERIIGNVCHQFVCPASQGQCPITEGSESVNNSERGLVTADGGIIPILKSVIPFRYLGEDHLMESFIDISHLKSVESELQEVINAVKESEERYRLVVELSPDGIAIEANNKFIFMNPAGIRLLGTSYHQIIGKQVSDILHPDYKETVMGRLEQELDKAERVTWVEEKYVRFDEKAVDVEVARVPFYFNGKPAIQTIFRDISDRKMMEHKLQRLALYDDLTGLPNRSLLFDQLRQLLSFAKRHGYVLAILYIDLDRFKSVNDTLGHEMGDLLLKEVSRRLTSSTRKSDIVARMGGDEFVGICGKIEAADDAAIVAQKLIDVLSKPFQLREHECTIGASIGISLHPEDGDDMEALLNKADEAMYSVKQRGKGGYLMYRNIKNT